MEDLKAKVFVTHLEAQTVLEEHFRDNFHPISRESRTSVDQFNQKIGRAVNITDLSENWRDNADVSQYLRELSGYGLDRINREPEVLTEEKSVLLEQTQDLVYHNYKTFIQTANCSQEIFKDFNLVEQHLDAVSSQLPDLIEKCQKFSKTSQETNASRRLNSMTLSRHTQLLEILEMPQLMDTCVRNGYYDEALDLSNYVFHLEKKFSSIPLICSITSDVQASLQLMLAQLIDQLRTNVQLPQCLRVISYLRRMEVFSEEELRIKFLQTRDSWFQSILADIPCVDPYEHITKVIAVSRVHLFDIMTQYRAIFSDDETAVQPQTDIMFCSRAAIIHSWVFRKVSLFLEALEKDLSQTDLGGRLDSVLGQCMYFGLSFGRVGADFRGLLVPIFVGAAQRNFEMSVDQVTNRFQESMNTFVLATMPMVMVSSVLEASSTLQDKLHPPLSLMEFNPLAELCNGLLTAFNNLRLLAPIAIVGVVRAKLIDCLLAAAKTIADFYRTGENSMTELEKETFSKLCHHFAKKLAPYVDCCFTALFPQHQLSQILGLSMSDFGQLKNLGHLDIEALLEPMAHLLPDEEKIEVNLRLESEIASNRDEPLELHQDTETEKDPILSAASDDFAVQDEQPETELPPKFQVGDDSPDE